MGLNQALLRVAEEMRHVGDDILTSDEVAVILPDLSAGCSMADMAGIDQLEDAWDFLTVATDGAELYETEHRSFLSRRYPEGFGEQEAAQAFETFLTGADIDHLLELSPRERLRIFNLGYFTWWSSRGSRSRTSWSERTRASGSGSAICSPPGTR